jgi:MFS family permease
MENARTRPSGMTAFTLIWLGQVASLLGTRMTQFGLSIWAWQKTGQATSLALVAFFNLAPQVILSPVAGALVDRWNRKLVMMLSDLAAGLCTIAILILYLSGVLEIWHLYIAGAITGVFQSFQFPAYSAAVTLMLSKEDYARADGMLALAQSIPDIGAPILAGILLGVIGIGGIIAIDIATFVLALTILLFMTIPQPPLSESGREGAGSLLSESLYGFRLSLPAPDCSAFSWSSSPPTSLSW